MLKSQVRKDLHKHSDDKLYRWVKDSIALYNMADLDETDVLEDIYLSLFSGMGALAAAYSLDHGPILETLRKTLEYSQQAHDAKESR